MLKTFISIISEIGYQINSYKISGKSPRNISVKENDGDLNEPYSQCKLADNYSGDQLCNTITKKDDENI